MSPPLGLTRFWPMPFNDLIIRMDEKLSVTSIAITHDLKSAYKIADRLQCSIREGLLRSGLRKPSRTLRIRLSGSSSRGVPWAQFQMI